MKVIYSIGSHLNGGGIGNTAYNAAEGVYKKGYLKKVVCSDYTPGKIPNKKVKKIRIQKYLIRYPLRFIEKFVFKKFSSFYYIDYIYDCFAKKYIEKCDIFHGWRNFSKKQMQKAKELGAVNIITNASSHPIIQKKLLEDEYKKYGIYYRPYTKKQFKRALEELEYADYIEIPSDFVEKSFLDAGIPMEKLIKVPFGVDLKKFYPKKNKKDEKFRVLFVGGIMLRKGVQYLLEAWSELRLKNAELVFVGNICPDAEKIIEKYKQDKTIKFVGFANPIDYYHKSDLFVFPSIEEGSALVTYEAMACGLPIIVTFNTGSIARDEKDGFILPIRDVEKLKNKIRYFYDNPKKCEEMGNSARKHVENYPWENYGKNLSKKYEKILKNYTLKA